MKSLFYTHQVNTSNLKWRSHKTTTFTDNGRQKEKAHILCSMICKSKDHKNGEGDDKARSKDKETKRNEKESEEHSTNTDFFTKSGTESKKN